MKSPWRERARKVIAEVMASMPGDATLTQVQKALRDAYPFGTREHHPYKMWCSEQRIAINQWRDKATSRESIRSMDSARVRVGVRMTFLKSRVGVLDSGHPWIDVICPWCKGEIAGGCMVCVHHHRAMIEALHHPERVAIARAAKVMEPGAREQLADWYRDHIPGLIEEGQ